MQARNDEDRPAETGGRGQLSLHLVQNGQKMEAAKDLRGRLFKDACKCRNWGRKSRSKVSICARAPDCPCSALRRRPKVQFFKSLNAMF